MTMPPPSPQGHSQPFGVPPSRFTSPPANAPAPRRRELGVDPAVERGSRRRVWPWLLGAAGTLAVIGLVVGLLVASFTAPAASPVGVASDGPVAQPPADPNSTLPTSSPVAPAAGATIPITSDVSFPGGITFVMPQPGTWTPSTSERQPDAVTLRDPDTGSYLQFIQTTQPAGHYRDEDLTRSILNRAASNFTGSPQNVGEPTGYYVSGAGYRLELLAQRIEWSSGSTVALLITRVMPNANANMQIFVIADASLIDNPSSSLWQKLGELTFTVP